MSNKRTAAEAGAANSTEVAVPVGRLSVLVAIAAFEAAIERCVFLPVRLWGELLAVLRYKGAIIPVVAIRRRRAAIGVMLAVCG